MLEFARGLNKDGMSIVWIRIRIINFIFFLGFDIIYESIGKDYVEANQEVIGIDSRWIVYSHQSGPEADKLSFTTLMKKRIII